MGPSLPQTEITHFSPGCLQPRPESLLLSLLPCSTAVWASFPTSTWGRAALTVLALSLPITALPKPNLQSNTCNLGCPSNHPLIRIDLRGRGEGSGVSAVMQGGRGGCSLAYVHWSKS